MCYLNTDHLVSLCTVHDAVGVTKQQGTKPTQDNKHSICIFLGVTKQHRGMNQTPGNRFSMLFLVLPNNRGINQT